MNIEKQLYFYSRLSLNIFNKKEKQYSKAKKQQVFCFKVDLNKYNYYRYAIKIIYNLNTGGIILD